MVKNRQRDHSRKRVEQPGATQGKQATYAAHEMISGAQRGSRLGDRVGAKPTPGIGG